LKVEQDNLRPEQLAIYFTDLGKDLKSLLKKKKKRKEKKDEVE
jgi:hypothetical protein